MIFHWQGTPGSSHFGEAAQQKPEQYMVSLLLFDPKLVEAVRSYDSEDRSCRPAAYPQPSRSAGPTTRDPLAQQLQCGQERLLLQPPALLVCTAA